MASDLDGRMPVVVDRHEGTDVEAAESRVDAGMSAQIDLGRSARESHHRFDQPPIAG